MHKLIPSLGHLSKAGKWIVVALTTAAAAIGFLVNARNLGLTPWLGLGGMSLANLAARRVMVAPAHDTLTAIGDTLQLAATVTDVHGAIDRRRDRRLGHATIPASRRWIRPARWWRGAPAPRPSARPCTSPRGARPRHASAQRVRIGGDRAGARHRRPAPRGRRGAACWRARSTPGAASWPADVVPLGSPRTPRSSAIGLVGRRERPRTPGRATLTASSGRHLRRAFRRR